MRQSISSPYPLTRDSIPLISDLNRLINDLSRLMGDLNKLTSDLNKLMGDLNELTTALIFLKKEWKTGLREEIRKIWIKLGEIDEKIERVSRMAREDVDAMAGDVIDLRQRVDFLENKVKELQAA